MNTLVQSLLLRRTKETKSTATGKEIVSLPPKKTVEHPIKLSSQEREVYDEVFDFSRNAMINYMKKHEDKDEDQAYMKHVEEKGNARDFRFKGDQVEEEAGNNNQGLAGKFAQGDVKAHHILVLLLRLRQICCHPGLIKSMLDAEARANDGIEDEVGDEAGLISQLADMSIHSGKAKGNNNMDEAVKKTVLKMDNPVFKEKEASSKIMTVIEELHRLKKIQDETGIVEKAVIVSQWT